MSKNFILFKIFYIIIFLINFSSSEKRTKKWTATSLNNELEATLLKKSNPNYEKNMKYFIFDPEHYLKESELKEAYEVMKTLSEKNSFSTHVFIISYFKDKNDENEEGMDFMYNIFVDNLSYLIYKDNPSTYNQVNTLSIVFFVKNKKMRIRATRELRQKITDEDAEKIFEKYINDYKPSKLKTVVNGFVKDILYFYSKKANNFNLIIFFVFLSIIVIGIIIFFFIGEQASEQEEKVKLFLTQLKQKEKPLEVFNETCMICLNGLLKDEESKENEKLEKKDNLEKEEITKCECGHKFHKRCITGWMKKDEKCPICEVEKNLKEKDNNSNEAVQGGNNNFINILDKILKIHEKTNSLNNDEINRIKNIFYPRNYVNQNLKEKIN